MNETRLFYVVDTPEANEEIFATLEAANDHYNTFKLSDKPRIRICEVRNAYKEESGEWNYEDYSDTFTTIKTLTNADA